MKKLALLLFSVFTIIPLIAVPQDPAEKQNLLEDFAKTRTQILKYKLQTNPRTGELKQARERAIDPVKQQVDRVVEQMKQLNIAQIRERLEREKAELNNLLKTLPRK